jgi:predicted phage terminase large subunit-like protein
MANDISAKEAAQELLDRRHARSNLLGFTHYTYPQFEQARHHEVIAAALEEFITLVEQKKSPGLLIFLPPRHGKSELVSRRLPGWVLGKHPQWQYISASYNDDFAADFGREVRNLVASPEYQNIFPGVLLRGDSRAANRWHTSDGGIYVSVGVGGSLTGRGGHVASIDDPFKDWEEANSETIREKKWNWYTSVIRTRLMPGGGIIVTQTRWHDDDIAGRILKQIEAGDSSRKWVIINLPAIAEHNDQMGRKNGEALWPEWYDEKALEAVRKDLSPMQWNSLYQQNPIPDEGEFFKKDWLEYYKEKPRTLRVFMASDYAVTEGNGDFTEHGVFGIDSNDDLYVLDWWHGQTASDEWIETGLDLIRQWKPEMWCGESGVIKKAVEPFLQRRMRERQDYCRLEWLPSIHDKPTRARAFQARMSQHKVMFPVNADWVGRLISQLMRFPVGTHDDAVDVCSLAGRTLEMIFRPYQYDRPSGQRQGSWMGS